MLQDSDTNCHANNNIPSDLLRSGSNNHYDRDGGHIHKYVRSNKNVYHSIRSLHLHRYNHSDRHLGGKSVNGIITRRKSRSTNAEYNHYSSQCHLVLVHVLLRSENLPTIVRVERD